MSICPTKSAYRLIAHGEGHITEGRSPYALELKETVRYADPSVWPLLAAVDAAWSSLSDGEKPKAENVGVILIDETGPEEAMRAITKTLDNGYASPLKFVAANPGSRIGVVCIYFKFQGPTLNLTMPPAGGRHIAEHVATRWLQSRAADCILLLERNAETLSAKCEMLGPIGNS